MSLSLPGNPVDPTQFANAWSPDNPNGSTWPAENFSNLVDAVPAESPVYQTIGGLDQLYGEIVDANVAPPPPDPAGQAAYEKALSILQADGTDFDDQGRQITVKVDSPFYVNYKNKSAAYNAALTSYLTNFLQYDLSKPDQARKWSILAPVLQAPVDQAYRDLQSARPGVIETAVATVGQYQQSSLASIFANARQIYTQTRRGSLNGDGTFWHVCQAFPGNWFAESAAANFSQITLTSRSLRISEDSHYSSYGAGGGVNFGLWRVGAGVSSQSQQYDMSSDTSDMTVSFSFGRIEIRRRWLNQSLLSLHGWSTAGRAPGDYSNGNPDDNPGAFPLLPTSFIVARDIKISANWGHTDLHTASQSTSVDASVGWGPFSLSGSYSNSSSTRRFNSQFDGTTITVPGIQIVAWVNAINPFCPPTGGPPSQPETRRLQVPAKRHNPYALPYMAPAPAVDLEVVLGRAPVRSAPAPAPAPAVPVSAFVSAEPEVAARGEPAGEPALMSEFVSAEN